MRRLIEAEHTGRLVIWSRVAGRMGALATCVSTHICGGINRKNGEPSVTMSTELELIRVIY